MASERQNAANRKNAQRSTGPRTPRGKAVVAKNALKHGLLARAALLPDEEEDEFKAFADELVDSLGPQGATEDLLAEQIVTSAWRLRRARRIEAGVLSQGWLLLAAEDMREQAALHVVETGGMTDLIAQPLAGTKREIIDPEGHTAALNVAAHFEHEARRGDVRVGTAWSRDAASGDSLSKLSRYEAALERSLLRAFHELQRLQALRAGQQVAAPVAVDVDLHVTDR